MKKFSLETLVGVFVLLGLLCVGYLTIRLGKLELAAKERNTYFARFTSVAGLKQGSSIEMAGVEIGKVARISLDPKEQQAVVEMHIDKSVPISDDAIVAVKTQGLIGDKYIRITPGGSPDLVASGKTLTETQPVLDIEDLISKYAFGSVK